MWTFDRADEREAQTEVNAKSQSTDRDEDPKEVMARRTPKRFSTEEERIKHRRALNKLYSKESRERRRAAGREINPTRPSKKESTAAKIQRLQKENALLAKHTNTLRQGLSKQF